MKVTPLNILRYWKRLMFPPVKGDYYMDRIMLRADLPWEPWLHCAVWIATIFALFSGDAGIIPPIQGVDWVWVLFGLISPPLGFFSVWALEHGRGKCRYIAIWSRMIADAGLVICLVTYLIARWDVGLLGMVSVVSDVIVFFSAWFTSLLVVRDVRFLVATEKLATVLQLQSADVDVQKVVERMRRGDR